MSSFIKKCVVILALASSPSIANAGFSLSLSTGLVSCLPSGQADCENTYPGVSIGSAMEVRFWHLGISLDFDHSWAIVGGTGSEDVSSTSLHLTPMLKGYYPIGRSDSTDEELMEIFLGIGTGYSSITVTDDASESEAHWSTFWQGMKITTGVQFDLSSAFGWPKGFEVDTSANIFINFGGSRCAKYANAGPCQPIEELKGGQQDVSGQLQLTGALRYTF